MSRSSPRAKRTGSCSGVSISAEGVERFGKIVDSKIIFLESRWFGWGGWFLAGEISESDSASYVFHF